MSRMRITYVIENRYGGDDLDPSAILDAAHEAAQGLSEAIEANTGIEVAIDEDETSVEEVES